MKKTLRLIALTALTLLPAATPEAGAVPAYPGRIKVTQPDGSVVHIRKTGDEHYALTLDDQGRPLVLDPTTGYYRPATPAEIEPEAEARRADARLRQPRKVRISDIPTLGRQQSLIILVEFSDRQFSMADPHDFYHRMLNDEGYTNAYGATGSARDFYLASSNGLYQPDFVVVGPVRLPRSYSYYGANRGYQSGIDYQIPEFVHDAALAADSLVDYAQFDSDADGMVDNIYFFYAGYGEADSGAQNTIWPHSANYYTDFEETLVLDGMYINRYACSQELSGQTSKPVGIGTFVHEYGHVLGLADHYNTQNQQAGGPGLWDTMANGSYLNNQHTPPLFSAFERAELGWLDYTELRPAEVDSIIHMPCLADVSLGYRVSVTADEYFVIENRQQKGWDRYLPGHGLLVWHVDMDERTWQLNKVNDDPTHQRLDLIEADRTPEHDGGDAFPGTKGVGQFSFTAWSGEEAFGFAAVDEQVPTVSFLLSGSAYVLAAPTELGVSGVMGRRATVSWTPSADAATYELTLLDDQGQPLLQETLDARQTSYELTDLQPQTDYTVSLVAHMADYASSPALLPFATTDLFYVERSPEALPATDVQAGGFTANWAALDATDCYYVSLAIRSRSALVHTKCDFTAQSASLPDGWTTSSRRFDTRYYGEASPSMRLSSDADYLLIGCPEGSRIVHLSFWYRSASEGNQLRIEMLKDGVWQSVVEPLVLPAAEAKNADFTVSEADSVRIVFSKQAQYVAIDDVVCSYLDYEFVPYFGQTMLPVGSALSYTFTNLTPATYCYTVLGEGPDGRSLPSQPVEVVVEAAPQSVEPIATQASAPRHTLYNMNGQRVSPAYRGLIVRDGRKFYRAR